MQLELQYGKDEILEAYLNHVPYGGNNEGAGAASLIYFGRPAEKLSLADRALALAVIPQEPRKRGGLVVQSRRRSAGGADGSTQALVRGVRAAPTRRAQREETLDRRADLLVQHRARALPFLAPHFVEGTGACAQSAPTAPITRSSPRSICRCSAILVEQQLHAYVERKSIDVGIKNAGALPASTRRTRWRSRACWSARRTSTDADAIAGQVNGVLAKRSPGSALKPFVYGLGLDEGIIHPMSMLKDAPLSFAAYSPENFDGRYVGPLSATDALVRSRNIPAVTVASKLSRPSFYAWLKMAGITHLGPEERYGLGLALGVAEVTMEELVGLYGVLANEGKLRTGCGRYRERPRSARRRRSKLLSPRGRVARHQDARARTR